MKHVIYIVKLTTKTILFKRYSEEEATENFRQWVRIYPGPQELQICEWLEWSASNSRFVEAHRQIVEGVKHRNVQGFV